MTEVLEIPLIAHDQEMALKFINLLPVQSESIYNGFILYTLLLNDDRRIYFYVLEPFEEMENVHVWERIIPKAPFSMMFFSWEEKVSGTPLEPVYNRYISHFSTPVVFLTGNSPEELDFSSINDSVLQAHLENILMYDSESADSAKSTLLQAMKLINDSMEQQLDEK